MTARSLDFYLTSIQEIGSIQRKVTILGIGGGAGKILNNISHFDNPDWIHLIHFDTDEEDKVSNNQFESIIIRNKWAIGKGCGGDPNLGENALRSELNNLRDKIQESDLLLIVACLGGGFASGGVQALSRLIREENIMTFFFVTFPFSFEGNEKKRVAEQALLGLRKNTDVVIAIQNDLLLTYFSEEKQVTEIFQLANGFLAEGIIGIAELVNNKGLLSVDIPNLKSVLNKKESFCSFGIGHAKGKDRVTKVIEDLFQSPTLGDRVFIDRADVIIATLIGDKNMSMGDLKKCLSEFNKQLNQETKTVIGATIREDKIDEIQMNMLVLQYPQKNRQSTNTKNKKKKSAKSVKKSSLIDSSELDNPSQPTLPFDDEGYSLGIFNMGPATIHHGQNLDIPTFQRQGINLDLENDPDKV